MQYEASDASPINSPQRDFVLLNRLIPRPTWEDMVIAYSTMPGYQSHREHDKGTWFIQSLVEVFQNHVADYELLDLLRMTSQRLSQFESDQLLKQTCNIEMRGLYKRLYFNPPKEQYQHTLKRLKSAADTLSDIVSPIDEDIMTSTFTMDHPLTDQSPT